MSRDAKALRVLQTIRTGCTIGAVIALLKINPSRSGPCKATYSFWGLSMSTLGLLIAESKLVEDGNLS